MSKPKDELEKMIGELALELHNSGSEVLSCDLPRTLSHQTPEINTVDYQVEEGELCFSSVESRSRVVAADVFREKRDILSADSKEWITVAHDLWIFMLVYLFDNRTFTY